MTTPLSDPDNIRMEIVEDEAEGYSVEDAYRVLANLPVSEPVEVPEEE